LNRKKKSLYCTEYCGRHISSSLFTSTIYILNKSICK